MAVLSNKFVAFFKELSAHNERDWFKANKKRFDAEVKEPFEALVGDVIKEMKKIDKEIDLEAKDCVFRIYRDVRFSKDKSPYKTHMAAAVGRGGRKDHTYPGVYFHTSAEGISVAGGCWNPDKDILYKIREAMVRDPKRIRKILDNKKFKETFGELGGEKNKIIPKEFRDAAETVPEIYNKSFHYWVEHNGQKNVTRPDLAKFIVSHYKIAKGWNDFLIEAQGF